MVRVLKTNKNVNSITPITNIYNRFWHKGTEINHKYNKLVGTQFMTPVSVETGAYCFRKTAFNSEKSRICKKNYFQRHNHLTLNLELLLLFCWSTKVFMGIFLPNSHAYSLSSSNTRSASASQTTSEPSGNIKNPREPHSAINSFILGWMWKRTQPR